MRLNGVTQFVRTTVRSWGISFLIAVGPAAVILLFIIPKQNSQVPEPRFPPLLMRSQLKYRMSLIAPAQLGVTDWQVGDYAEYRHRSRRHDIRSLTTTTQDAETKSASLSDGKNVGFHIINELKTSDSHSYWVKMTGLISFRDIEGEIYQLGTPSDMRISSENRRYEFIHNYIPIMHKSFIQSSVPLATLVKLGQEEIETEAGRFHCTHYRVELGAELPTQEVWVNSQVRPWGIVRMQSRDDVLELIAYGEKTEITIPDLFQSTIQGVSKLDQGCTSCHAASNCHEFISPPK